MLALTQDQKRALNEHPGEPLCLVDPETQRADE